MNNTFSSRQSVSGRDHASRAPLPRNPLENARAEAAPAARAHFSPLFPLPWQSERAERLHRLCKTIERRRAAGMAVRKAVKHFTWFWKDRPYRTAPHIRARFSRATLVILYFRWRRHGKSPRCFDLHYGARYTPVKPADLRRFVRACGAAGITSFRQAARLAGFERAMECRIRARLPCRLVSLIEGIFKERRAAEFKARSIVKHYQADLKFLMAADAARSRKLAKGLKSFIGRRGVGTVESTSGRLEAPIQGRKGPLQAIWKGVTK